MQKGDFIELNIIDMSQEGAGIGKADDGMTVFVSGAVVGDRVRVGINNVKKNYATGKAVAILEESEYRAENVCPNIEQCGGCGYGKIQYRCQLILKEKSVHDKLTRIAGLDAPTVLPIIGADALGGYRNKAVVAVYEDKVGFKAQKSNLVFDCEECAIQHPKAMDAARALRGFLRANHAKGAVESMMVRVTNNDEVMVVVNRVKNKKGRPVDAGLDWEALALAIDEATGYCLESFYLDDKLTAGHNTVLSSFADFSGEVLNFEISPTSFYQVNSKQMENLYAKVAEFAELSGSETVLDLYCGIGTIGLYLARKAGMVYGIESVKSAILDANRNATINGIVNARYFLGKAEDVLPEMLREMELESVDVVVLDPPRAGCDAALLETVVSANPSRIVYVSCDPGTLARDVKFLGEHGYAFEKAQPVDMFPMTVHVECVALLSKAAK